MPEPCSPVASRITTDVRVLSNGSNGGRQDGGLSGGRMGSISRINVVLSLVATRRIAETFGTFSSSAGVRAVSCDVK
jgi:hypothetical protein